MQAATSRSARDNKAIAGKAGRVVEMHDGRLLAPEEDDAELQISAP